MYNVSLQFIFTKTNLKILFQAFCVHLYTSQIITISCPSCGQYSILVDNVSLATLTCTTGTFCNSTSGTYSIPCSANYSCNSTYANATTSYSCTTVGTFAYPSNCQQYYRCFLDSNGTGFTYLIMSCPGSTFFDTASLKCTTRTNRVCGNVTYVPTPVAG